MVADDIVESSKVITSLAPITPSTTLCTQIGSTGGTKCPRNTPDSAAVWRFVRHSCVPARRQSPEA